MRRRRFVGVAAAGVLFGGGCVTVGATTETETSTHELADEAVTVSNPDGDVTVRTADRDDVRIEAARHYERGAEDALSDTEVTTERADGRFAVAVAYHTEKAARAVWVDLTVTVPSGPRSRRSSPATAPWKSARRRVRSRSTQTTGPSRPGASVAASG